MIFFIKILVEIVEFLAFNEKENHKNHIFIYYIGVEHIYEN